MPSPTNTSSRNVQSNAPLYTNLQVEQANTTPVEEKSILVEGAKSAGAGVLVTGAVGGAGYGLFKSGKWAFGKIGNAVSSVANKVKGIGTAGKIIAGTGVGIGVAAGGYGAYEAHSSNQEAKEADKKLHTEITALKQNIALNLTTDEYKAALQYAKNISPNLLERQILDELIKNPSELFTKKAEEKNLRPSAGNTEKEKEANLYRYEKAFRERVINDYRGRSQQLRRASGVAQHTQTPDQDLLNINPSASNALAQSAQPIKETAATEENLNISHTQSNSGKGMA